MNSEQPIQAKRPIMNRRQRRALMFQRAFGNGKQTRGRKFRIQEIRMPSGKLKHIRHEKD